MIVKMLTRWPLTASYLLTVVGLLLIVGFTK